MRVVLLEDDQVLCDQLFHDGPILVGAEAAMHVHLPDMALPLQVAKMVAAHTGQWMIELADAQIQATINGRVVGERCPIYNGDVLEIGRFRLKIAVDGGFDLGVKGRSSLEELARIKEFPLPPGSEVRRPQEPLSLAPEQVLRNTQFTAELLRLGDIETLMRRALDALVESLNAGTAWYGLRRRPTGELGSMECIVDGVLTGQEPQGLASLEFRCLERSQSILIARKKSMNQQSALAVPLEAKRGCFGLLYVEAKADERRFQMASLDQMMAIATVVALRLEELLLAGDNAVPPNLADEEIELAMQVPPAEKAAANILAEQEVAALSCTKADSDSPIAIAAAAAPSQLSQIRCVQLLLNTKRVPRWSGYEVGIHFQPGRAAGGDIYDAMTMPNGLASLLLANAHSAREQSAVALAEARSAFRVGGLHGDPPHTLLKELGWLAEDLDGGPILAAANVLLNPKTGAFQFAIAGPLALAVIGANRQARKLTASIPTRLGGSKTSDVPRSAERLRKGETLVLLSPGCEAMQDSTGAVLGQERLIEVLAKVAGNPPSDMFDDLTAELAGFFKQSGPKDDICLVVLRRT